MYSLSLCNVVNRDFNVKKIKKILKSHRRNKSMYNLHYKFIIKTNILCILIN